MELPCKKCLCVPICRHKYYQDMFRECSLLSEFAHQNKWTYLGGPHHVRVELYKIIKPTKWEVDNKGYFVF